MKLKILQLLFLFLVTGLFVSSKGTADNCKIKCELRVTNSIKEKINNTKQKETAGNPFALAPGSYIFYY